MTVVDSVRHPLFDRFELLLPGTNRDKWIDVFISSQLLNFLARHRGRATRVPKRHALILFQHFRAVRSHHCNTLCVVPSPGVVSAAQHARKNSFRSTRDSSFSFF